MMDICQACGRMIFTVHPVGMGITLALQWTHGGFGFVDRQHVPMPRNHEFKVVRR